MVHITWSKNTSSGIDQKTQRRALIQTNFVQHIKAHQISSSPRVALNNQLDKIIQLIEFASFCYQPPQCSHNKETSILAMPVGWQLFLGPVGFHSLGLRTDLVTDVGIWLICH